MSGQPISGHKGRDRWMCALAAAPDLSTMAFRLALRLCVSFNCKTGQCDPGYPALAKDMAVSERTVFRAIAELQAAGWISIGKTGGANTRHNQFALLIPSASGDNILSPEEPPSSGDNMLSPEDATGNGASGDKNRGGQVTENGPSGDTQRVTPKEPVEPDEPVQEDRPVTTTNTESDHEHTLSESYVGAARARATDTCSPEPLTPVPRAVARTEPVEAQDQPPSRGIDIGRPANGADGSGFGRFRMEFERLAREYPQDRIGDKAAALLAFNAAVRQRGVTMVVKRITAMLERGGDVPDFAEALAIIERNPSAPHRRNSDD